MAKECPKVQAVAARAQVAIAELPASLVEVEAKKDSSRILFYCSSRFVSGSAQGRRRPWRGGLCCGRADSGHPHRLGLNSPSRIQDL